MRHCRTDYEAIQPWPTKRPHIAKQLGNTVEVPDESQGWDGVDARAQMDMGRVQPLIPDDEPVFILRSMDVVGPRAVREWAAIADREGADFATVQRVLRWADEMEAYAAEHGGAKVPDTPADLLRP